MMKDILPFSTSEQQTEKINKLTAAYAQMFLSVVERKLDAHLNPIDPPNRVSWSDKDLV